MARFTLACFPMGRGVAHQPITLALQLGVDRRLGRARNFV